LWRILISWNGWTETSEVNEFMLSILWGIQNHYTWISAYISGMLSISPSGIRRTPWYLSEQRIPGVSLSQYQKISCVVKILDMYTYTRKFIDKMFFNLFHERNTEGLYKPNSALACTPSHILFIHSISVSFDNATSSPMISCMEKLRKLDECSSHT
jgi:hypothetical protein